MNDARNGHQHQEQAPPGRRAAGLILALAAALVYLLVTPAAFAQSKLADSKTSLIYLADSENRRLNQRVGELLAEALGESVEIRPFGSPQTSYDIDAPVIAIGPTAFEKVREADDRIPVLGLFVEEAFVNTDRDKSDQKVSAILSTPPLMRQVAIGKAILPYSTRVAMLARPETEHLYDQVIDDLKRLGMEGRVFLVPSDERLIPALIRALDYGDFVLAASDPTIYNPRTIKHVLLTSYRRNRIVIGPSQAYVKAGSLASSFTPLREIANMAADYVRYFRETKEFPEPAHPVDFGIEVNRQVGRSLNIPLPDGQALISAVRRRLDSMEASANEQ